MRLTPRSDFVFSLLVVFGVGLVWVLLYELNGWLFSALGVTAFISWVFLPAAIRMLSVMLFDWRAVGGLFLGALVTIGAFGGRDIFDAVVLASLSSLGPMCAFRFCVRWLNLPGDLTGLAPRQLLLFALVGALCNVVPHNLYFFLSGHMDDPVAGVIPMFVGDVSGTLILLYLAALVVKAWFPVRR